MDPQLQQSGIFVLAIFLAVLAERGWQWLRRRQARHWPTAQGHVTMADWRQPRTGTNRYFVAELAYYYFVDGHFFSGYHRRSFSNAADASDWVRRMQDADIQVRYKTAAPGHSMLLEEELVPEASDSVADKPELVTAGD